MRVLTIHEDGSAEEFDIKDDLFTMSPLPLHAAPEPNAYGHASALLFNDGSDARPDASERSGAIRAEHR
jgi:hypothetical protein